MLFESDFKIKKAEIINVINSILKKATLFLTFFVSIEMLYTDFLYETKT